jgi:Fe2+ transport system protein FeoA
MTLLNQLKSGDIARIIAFENGDELKKKFVSREIKEGSIVRIISCFGLITFNTGSKIFSVSKGIAENVEVIKIKTGFKGVS